MFDWPEHSHTSPTSTSPTLCVAPPELAVNVYGPPAFIAGNDACQCPDASARALLRDFASVTVTSSPGPASPQTWIGRSRCSTACSWNIACRRNASVSAAIAADTDAA